MKRLEQDPDEIREIEEAITRAATPSHDRVTEEFDSLAVISGLGEFGVTFGKLKLKDPPESGWEQVES